jgi:hypothetical protein
MDEYYQRRKKEELQKTEERIKKEPMAKAKKEYLESICGEISEFQRARLKI